MGLTWHSSAQPSTRNAASALLAALALLTALVIPSARWLGPACIATGPVLANGAGTSGDPVCELHATSDRAPLQPATVADLLLIGGFVVIVAARAARPIARNERRPDGRTVAPLVPPPTSPVA